MLVIKKTYNQRIANSNKESTKYKIVFSGTKKECENYLLATCNELLNYPYFESVTKAVRYFKKKNTINLLWRDKKKSLYLNYEYRSWMIVNKKWYKEYLDSPF